MFNISRFLFFKFFSTNFFDKFYDYFISRKKYYTFFGTMNFFRLFFIFPQWCRFWLWINYLFRGRLFGGLLVSRILNGFRLLGAAATRAALLGRILRISHYFLLFGYVISQRAVCRFVYAARFFIFVFLHARKDFRPLLILLARIFYPMFSKFSMYASRIFIRLKYTCEFFRSPI